MLIKRSWINNSLFLHKYVYTELNDFNEYCHIHTYTHTANIVCSSLLTSVLHVLKLFSKFTLENKIKWHIKKKEKKKPQKLMDIKKFQTL